VYLPSRTLYDLHPRGFFRRTKEVISISSTPKQEEANRLYMQRRRAADTEAKRKHDREYYAKSGAPIRARVNRRRLRHKAKVEALRVHCEWCGTKENLHFHHLLPEMKHEKVSKMMTCAWATIAAEINKCLVLCKPCHIKAHQRMEKK